ncbi:T9SS type A sorting domain-containing protein [Mesohalobacter halotolerans]|uniref:T9SS type A sorting domain-containing protein n=1 Tax=Mesohalobacter halotolerans TaxID=1883405 RepID=A0A4U5TU00_9FLAO|nr:T9SS type A sorting domain-containing protein [Mesohalobacter halotolerans]TKS57572.1 T9SS type A sorting domain-containing protein [Mesohalobacter halotolerans]
MKTLYFKSILFGLLTFLATGLSFGQTTIVEQDFDAASTWNYESDIPFFDCNSGSDFLGIRDVSATGLDLAQLSTNILSEQDLESSCGTSGEAIISFPSLTTSTDISTYTGVNLSFDYDVEGYNANSDEVHYELFYDGVGQGRVVLQTGSTPGDDSEGSVSVNVPDTVDDIRLEIIIENNGGSGESGFDNFRLTGTASGSTPTVGFDATSSTENETNSTFSVSIPVTLSNFSSNVDLSVSVNGSSTTAESGDYTLNTTSLSFTGNATQNISLDINDDADSDDETIILDIAETTSTGITINPDQHTLTVVDDEITATTLPYSFDFTNDPFNNDWQQFSVSGAEQWEYTGSGAQMNAFNSGCQINEDWLITPFFDLDSYNNEELSFTTSEGFSGTDLEVLYSTDYSGTGDPNNANWTTITTITSGNAGTESNNTSLQGVSGNQVYVAFKYVFSSVGCSEWTITDFDLQAIAAGANIPPSISNITQTPATGITSSDAVTVSADVTDSDGTINNVELNWGTTSGSLGNTINMSNTSGDTYETDSDIPAQSDGTTVYYEIAATDDEPETTTSTEQSYDVNDLATFPYSEDFTGQNGKGATGGSTVSFDLTGVDWTLDIIESGLGASSDWFRVENEEFSARDVDDEQVWNSPVIDISGETDVDITIDVSSVIGELESSDYIETGYVLDGGSFTTITKHDGEITGTITDSESLTGLSNSTLKIVIKVLNNAGSEFYYFDNISVEAPPTYTYTDDTTGWNTNPVTGTPASTSADEIEVLAGTAVLNGVIQGNNLSISSGATLELGASAVLELDGDITNDGTILFTSDTNGSAQLDDFSGSITGTGDVTVERFIPVATEVTRGFRFLTSAVNSTDPIYDNWQESGNSPAGFGTHITGSSSGANGFDVSISGNPSMYEFDNSYTVADDAWSPISDTDPTKLDAGKAYLVFIRGDRNYDLDSDPADAPNTDVTLRATGDLAVGNQTFSLNPNQDLFSFVGNPYQAIVNINDVSSTNINTNFYWVWDPNMSTRGAYVAVDLSTGDSQTPAGGASSSAADQFVMPGQSFFVQTVNNGAADITFTESSKDVSATSTAVFSDNNQTSLNLKLYKTDDLNAQKFESDALQINFDNQFDNTVNIQDADKLMNPDENLSRNENDELVSIEKRSLPSDGESLELFTDGFTANDYTFVITNNNLPDDVEAYLVDQYTGDQTLLNDGSNQISFSVDQNIPGSIATDRFSIDFEIDTFSINNDELSDNFTIYPNPVRNGQVSIQSINLTGDASVRLYNIMGQRVFNQRSTFKANGKTTVNLGNLQSGVYFIEIDQNGQTSKERLIIK